MVNELSRFQPFVLLDRATLQLIARHAGLVDLPARRWLVRRGRTISGHHFLVSGTVRSFGPDRLIRAGDRLAADAIYPGAQGLATLTECRLLQLGDEGLALLAREEAGLAWVSETDDCWQRRFLRSHLMTSLPPLLWQQVLSKLTPREVNAGERLLIEGADRVLDRCYLLARGRAVVSRCGRVLGSLGPGELFGEDALISDRPRNATVRMLEEGTVMDFPVADFRDFLTSLLNHGVFEKPRDTAFSNCEHHAVAFDTTVGLREKVERLDVCVGYSVSATAPEICALALFLMRKRGLLAWSNRPGFEEDQPDCD